MCDEKRLCEELRRKSMKDFWRVIGIFAGFSTSGNGTYCLVEAHPTTKNMSNTNILGIKTIPSTLQNKQ